jgi:hypothetical protein
MTSVEPSECDGTPSCVQLLHQDDTVKGLLARCAGLEGECRNTGVRLEVHRSETRGFGNVPELLESEARGLEGGLGSMPKDITCWVCKNSPSVDTQRRVRLKAESCDKARSADTCVRITGVGFRETDVVQTYAEGCTKRSAAVTRVERVRPPRYKAEGYDDAKSMPAGAGACNVDMMSQDTVLRGLWNSRGRGTPAATPFVTSLSDLRTAATLSLPLSHMCSRYSLPFTGEYNQLLVLT